MPAVRLDINVRFQYEVHFTEGLFAPENRLLAEVVSADGSGPRRIVFVLDAGLCAAWPGLVAEVIAYGGAHRDALLLAHPPLIVPGGEAVKNDARHVAAVQQLINEARICRHSYLVAVGGGAVLDMAGYAAATAHRGVRLIRVPTTVLAQNDSGVGVKNSVNAFGKKNFLGTFAPPFAVLNDGDFLATLSDRDWRSGMSEAVKVALIQDGEFFNRIERDAVALVNRDREAMRRLIRRCAEMHVRHIAGGDAFEQGSSRPLDFGHWAAHKLEQLTDFSLRHGEAVAMGIALDTTYSCLAGMLSEPEWRRVIALLRALGFSVYAHEMRAHIEEPDHPRCLLRGLAEFQEHLGGDLTITLLNRIGDEVEVHEMECGRLERATEILRQIELAGSSEFAGGSECNLSPIRAR